MHTRYNALTSTEQGNAMAELKLNTEKLAADIEASGLRYNIIAERAGISYVQVYRLRKGMCRSTDSGTLELLARQLGTKASDYFVEVTA